MSHGGNCYLQAGYSVLNWRGCCPVPRHWTDVVLCHGYPTGTGGDARGRVYGHAWVEGLDEDGVPWVLDAVTGVTLPQEVYYAVGSIDAAQVQRYSPQAARQRKVEYEHWGPWDNVPPDAAFG
jgi:hypothetical protein